MTPPELRITDAEMAECPRRDVACSACGGSGVEVRPGLCGPVTDWCCECWGAAWSIPCLPPGASARLGAMIIERLPHLRHAVWPPKRYRADRSTVATALAMIGAVGL